MPNEMDPIVGNWYCHRSKGQLFQVITIEADRLICIQRFDGDIEELEMDAWRGLDIDPAEPPEDWTGPLDQLDPEDCGYTDAAMDGVDWRRATAEYPCGLESWEPDELEAQLDDWDDGLLAGMQAPRRRTRRSAAPPPATDALAGRGTGDGVRVEDRPGPAGTGSTAGNGVKVEDERGAGGTGTVPDDPRL